MTLAITFVFCLILARLLYVQTAWSSELKLRAADQWNREIPVIAERGKISDRNGVEIVSNRSTYTVFVRPNAVVNSEYTATVLGGVFNLDPLSIKEKLERNKVSEITLIRQTDKQNIEKLVSYDLPGVYFARDNTREYAYDDILCQVLGFTASDGTGVTGLEKFYDAILAGKNGEISYSTDIVGVETKNSKVIYREAVAGAEIRLTIDMDIQMSAEAAVKNVYNSSGAKAASCIVLDPRNFDVLAMVNYPSYNLNEVPRDDAETLNALTRNVAISNIYEPGSTFKVITAAANIEESLQGNDKAFSDSYIFNSSRTRTVDGTKIKCWSDHSNGKHSNQTLAEALNNSCNPCFTDIALSLGKETFYGYLNKFGFGNVTGIDFSGEALGMLVPETAVRDCDLARIGFGQTVAVTEIQLACAIAAAINGGEYYVPRLLKSVISSDGEKVSENAAILKNRVISEEASRRLSAMLEGVVKEGSGKHAYIEGYKVGGKTGTAQKYEDGHVAQGKYVSSFAGFFPSDNPRYLTLIIVDEPQGTYYGSAVAAPVAKEIFEDIIKLKNIAPFE